MFSEIQRAYMLKALRCVDRVVIVKSGYDAVRKVRPHVFVKGVDYIGKIEPRILEFCNKHLIQVRCTVTQKLSATEVGNALRGR